MYPEITVLMAIHNEEKYLRYSIESILKQTFTNFEFLIVDDGSTDDSAAILASYRDPRIKYIHNQYNIGLTKSLNLALAQAKGTYILRMDADDTSCPERFAKQHSFMSRNPHVGVCGTWLQTIGDKPTIWKVPVENDRIRATLFFENALYHPTVIFRRLLFKDKKLNYDESLSCSQDYDLWVRCAEHMEFANIDEVLLKRRIHSSAVGSINKVKQLEIASQVRQSYLKTIGIIPVGDELGLHNSISACSRIFDRQLILSTERWLLKLQDANKSAVYIPDLVFREVLSRRWYNVCRQAQRLGLWTWRTFCKSTLSDGVTLQAINRLGFCTKCFLRI